MPITGRPPTSLRDRFNKQFRIDPNGCWMWTGAIDRLGYGVITERLETYKKRQEKAHRASYRLHIGPIPEKHDVHHKCHHKACVNPSHLEAMPDGEHSLLHGWPATNIAKTHCKHGHPFDEANTFLRYLKNGRIGRGCRACRSLHSLEYYRMTKNKMIIH